MTTTTAPHVIPPTSPHTHTIIFLHGRGSNGPEFCSELMENQASDDRFFTDIFPGFKWIFPSSGQRWAKTENENMEQWFDMASVQHPEQEPEIQVEGLKEGSEAITALIKKEVEDTGIPLNKIFLAGMSQGCATALYTLLRSDMRLAGFIGLSGWLPVQVDVFRDTISVDAKATPVLLEHCEDDFVVPVKNGVRMRGILVSLGMEIKMVVFHEGGHWLQEPEGMDAMVEFVQRCM